MSTATHRELAVGLVDESFHDCRDLLGAFSLNEAIRRQLRSQGPIRVNSISIVRASWEYNMLHPRLF